MVGVGQFASGLDRRRHARRQLRGFRRVGAVVGAVLVGVVLVLVIVGRLAGHL
jgi:hypothetical protein